jgi:RNA polymerase sigma-70 factor (ECF subfamily)
LFSDIIQGAEEIVMPHGHIHTARSTPADSDVELARRALARDGSAFRAIMQIHNRRLYRIARSVLRDDAEAEDALQEAYLNAFAHLDGFRGDSSLATWLSRIVINEALGRRRKKRRKPDMVTLDGTNHEADIIPFPIGASADDPERTTAQRQILQLVERATDELPDIYRVVFVARVIEGLNLEETAVVLGLQPQTVKTRLHRARRLLRERLDEQIGTVLMDAFPFAGRRCERVIAKVMAQLGFTD